MTIYFRRTGSYTNQKNDSDSNDDFHIPRILNFISTFKTPFTPKKHPTVKSDFDFGSDKSQFERSGNNVEVEGVTNEEFTTDKDTYRTKYRMEAFNTLSSSPDTESDYFKYIESKYMKVNVLMYCYGKLYLPAISQVKKK
jgi:hypothetical protein